MATKEEIIAQKTIATERYILSTMPVLYLPLWKLDGSSFTSADGHGHTCTVTGATWGSQGRIFAGGTDGIVSNTKLFTAYPFTLSGWIKATSRADDASVLCWLGDKDVEDIHYLLRINAVTGFASVLARNTNAYINSGVVNLFGSFHYLTAVFASATSRLLNVDGVNVATGTDSVAYSSDVDIFSIGYARRFTPDSHAKGTIGEVFGWSRSLSVGEDMNNYLATKWRYQ